MRGILWLRYSPFGRDQRKLDSKCRDSKAKIRTVIKHHLNRVKNGIAARSPELGLTAHGLTEELARRNLEHLVLPFLRPFERQGTLEEQIRTLGLLVEGSEGELTVVAVS